MKINDTFYKIKCTTIGEININSCVIHIVYVLKSKYE